MVRIIDREVLSSDKQHMLKGKIYIPDHEAKGMLHVVHGMCEYIGRYDSFMREMAEYGYITFGYDHLGHGNTATSEKELGFIATENGAQHLVDDVFIFSREIRKSLNSEELPLILMGHSMGSFIVRLTAAEYDHYDKLIVMGTGGPNPAAGVGLMLCKILKGIKTPTAYSDFIEKMAFGTYNKGFEKENDPYSWLSVSLENRDRYRVDPFCTYHFTISALQDLVKLNKDCNSREWFKKINKSKPILLTSGSDDPVGEHGDGVRKVYDTLKASGANVELKLYDGFRHEILQDYCRDKVVADIKAFIEK